MRRTRKTVRAAKLHKCIGCGLPIYPGKRYIHEKWLEEDLGQWVNHRFHSITCEFDFIVIEKEFNDLYDTLEEQYDKDDCIYTTSAIHPLAEDVPQYEDDDYSEPWD